ncbi:MAG TPA: tetratricopeptide repeat protein [Polyangia bacterium]|nr:tetratricopeptide repeat protein [Polyangia bacterium]
MIVALLASKAAYAQLTPQQKQDIHTHYQQATRAYDLGKYQEAIDEYQKVYEIDGDPVMLYNIAQAYRLNDQPQDSIHFYRRYLQRSPEARNRDDVERKIAGQEKLIEDRRKAAAAVTPPPISSSKNPPPAVIETKPDTSVTSPPVAPPPVVVVSPPPPPPPSKSRKIVGWSMVGVGVAADVVAIIEGVVAKNRGDELTQMSKSGTNPPPVFDPNIQSQGKTANIVAIVCGITGTAVAVTGAILLITNGSSSPPAADTPTESGSSPNVSFMPWLAPGLVGGGMGMRF